jgi:membrane protease YdiL (CAAX protease family)
MTDGPLPGKQETSPWLIAFASLMSALIGFTLIGPFVGLTIAYPFYDGDAMSFIQDVANPVGKEQMKMISMFVQGCATFVGLAIIPALFWRGLTGNKVWDLFKGTQLKPIHFLLVTGIVIFSLGFLSVVIKWNANIDLPDGEFERMAKALEEKAAEITRFLTTFTNAGQYLTGVFVIAVLAAVGEEIVFRGLLQTSLQKSFRNAHIAIWVSAIFFSAFHMQFYGFFPRMLLGALFGYLYYWSGNLFVPMFAHFMNNFLAVTSIYSGMNDLPGLEDSPTAETAPWYVIVLMTAIAAALIFMFQKQFQKTNDVRA